MHLSKSDFKVARTCGTKLFYKKSGYPSTKDDNPYLEFLADGGYMVETIAKLSFPEGKEIEFNSTEKAIKLTLQELNAKNITLFEATVVFGRLLARIDILEKTDKHFRIIEVKAKSFSSETDGLSPFRGEKGNILATWRPYLEDITFQVHVLQNVYPDVTITPCLCLVDKTATCGEAATFDKFHLTPRSQAPGTMSRPIVKFLGDINALRNERLVRIVDVTQEVEELLPTVRESAERFANSLNGVTPARIPPVLNVRCKKCEYRFQDFNVSIKDGFRECWGSLAQPSPHLLDLYRVDALGRKGEVAQLLIEQGRCALKDVPTDLVVGKVGERQSIQLEWTQRNEEFFSPQLKGILAQCKYPLHFLDFEASRIAVPYHAGMRPYGLAAFQWSCHTISEPGSDLEHSEWINVTDAYPNLEFIKSLQQSLNTFGTIFTWSPFERSSLRDIQRQLLQYGRGNERDLEWLDHIASDNGPLFDLCNLCKAHYFHPKMGGSLSIKRVLPAVWFESDKIRNHPWFADFLRTSDGKALDPYKTLDSLPYGDDDEEVDAVREGTAAIRTYQEMLYGIRRADASFKEAQKKALLNYCKLDTAAMVMIWMHWSDY